MTLAMLQALLGRTSEAQFIRYAHAHLQPWFPSLPHRPGYDKRLRHSGQLFHHVAADSRDEWPERPSLGSTGFAGMVRNVITVSARQRPKPLPGSPPGVGSAPVFAQQAEDVVGEARPNVTQLTAGRPTRLNGTIERIGFADRRRWELPEPRR